MSSANENTQVPATTKPEVGIEQIEPIDLRVGLIESCEAVEGSTKLLKLTVSLGELGTRTIFSGLAKSYSPATLVGKYVAVFANLLPRKMRFGVSEGMVLAAGSQGDQLSVVELGRPARAGDAIS